MRENHQKQAAVRRFYYGSPDGDSSKKWSRVIVAAPNPDMAERLKAVLSGVSVVDIQGERIKLDDAARAAFIVCTYADFPAVL